MKIRKFCFGQSHADFTWRRSVAILWSNSFLIADVNIKTKRKHRVPKPQGDTLVELG